MSVTFKQFLSEAAVKSGAKPKFEQLEVKRAIDALNTHCKNALWMLTKNKPIFRGMGLDAMNYTGFSSVDSSATERQSENTSNYYTVILDNHPGRKKFPKRSRSFIGTTERFNANSYGRAFILVPYDDVPIGVVNESDMWDTDIKMFGYTRGIEKWNDSFENAGIKPTMKSILEFDAKLKAGDEAALKKFDSAFEPDMGAEAHRKTFLKTIWDAYSKENTGHDVCTTATLPAYISRHTEVWIGGKMIVISLEMWDQMRQSLFKDEK